MCSCGSWEIHGNKIYQELLTTETLPPIPEQSYPPVLRALLETSQKWLLWWAVLHLPAAGLSALQTDTVQRQDGWVRLLGICSVKLWIPLGGLQELYPGRRILYGQLRWAECNFCKLHFHRGWNKSWLRNTIWKCWFMSELFFFFIETDLLPARKKSNHCNFNEVR